MRFILPWRRTHLLVTRMLCRDLVKAAFVNLCSTVFIVIEVTNYSAFYCLYVYQFIQQAIRRDFSNVDEILNPPDGQDEGVWKYEHLRYHFYFIIIW